MARTFPAKDYTGATLGRHTAPAQHAGPIESRIDRESLDILADRITVGPSRGSYTIADLQRSIGRDR